MFATLALVTQLWAVPATAEIDIKEPWIHGVEGEAALQVQAVAPGTWILRQSKRSHFEAPFLYLLAGKERALLLDSGAEPVAGQELPLRTTVDGLLADWAREQQLETLPLTVAHSHAHLDHRFGDGQFADRAETIVVGHEAPQVAAFFGLKTWPDAQAEFDLGDRKLTVIAIPGHEAAHIAIYDPATLSLLSGDSLYPGLLTVRDRSAYVASIDRLKKFARKNEIRQVLGAHVEMSSKAGVLYPLGSTLQPAEHALELDPRVIGQVASMVAEHGDFVGEVASDEFALMQVREDPEKDSLRDESDSIHGMLGVGSETIYLSHLPMFHAPHNYQLIFEASLPALDADHLRLLYAQAKDIVTVVPTERWVLPEVIKPGAKFKADIYAGHFERGGTRVRSNVPVTVARIVHFRRFEAAAAPDPTLWLAFGRGNERFLAHRIEGAPDFDQIVQVEAGLSPATQLSLKTAGALARGVDTPHGKVRRVIYTETGDLKDAVEVDGPGEAEAVVEPKVVEPEVVEPAVVEPEVVEPKVAEPEVVEPPAVVELKAVGESAPAVVTDMLSADGVEREKDVVEQAESE